MDRDCRTAEEESIEENIIKGKQSNSLLHAS